MMNQHNMQPQRFMNKLRPHEHKVLTAHNWPTGKNEKEYSWHNSAMKFIGMKPLV